MSSDEREYYGRRVLQESSAADAAACPQARNAHLELAKRYWAMLSSVEPVSVTQPFHGYRRG